MVLLHADFLHAILACFYVRKGCFHGPFTAAKRTMGTVFQLTGGLIGTIKVDRMVCGTECLQFTLFYAHELPEKLVKIGDLVHVQLFFQTAIRYGI